MASLLHPQQKVAGYEILEQVGKGGMGEVYRARQVSMDRIVALKILSPKLVAKDPAFTERFIAEARAAGRLNHPNIIGVHDVGQTTLPQADGSALPIHYFSMEFVEGETVKDLIERHGAMDLDRVIPIATAMAEALVYAEAQRVVHRDIKPENIMVTNDGMVKLADLGLAEQVSDEVEDDPDPKARKVMGTPMYMSPEQARGLTVGHGSDQYSLGATLFHMLTGRAPFVSKDAKGLMRAHVLEPIPDPHDLVSDLSEGWRQLCMRLMAKDPAQRFPTAADMKAAIAAAITGGSLQSRRTRAARTGPVVTGARRPSSSPVIGVVIAAAIIVAAVGGWFVFGRGNRPAQPELANDPVAIEQPAVDTSLVAAKKLVEGLGNDAQAALTALDQALADGSLSEAARGVLQNERGKRKQVIDDAEAALKKGQEAELAAISAQIAAGDLSAARERLKALPGKNRDVTAERRAEVTKQWDAAVEKAGKAILGDIPKADATVLTQLEGKAATLPLAAADQDAIAKAITSRRSALDAEAAKALIEPNWRALARALEGARYQSDYASARTAMNTAVSAFSDAATRVEAQQLLELAELAQQTETWLRNACRTRPPSVDMRISGTVRKVAILGIEDDTVQVRPTSAPIARMERMMLPLDWKALTDGAFNGLPGDVRKLQNRYQLGYCAFWAPDAATALAEAMGDDPLAAAYRELDKRRPWPRLMVPVKHGDQSVSLKYELIPGDQRLPVDFKAEGLEAGDFGLRWRSTGAVERGDFSEDHLPAMLWNARMRPPCTIKARVRLNRETLLTMIGIDIEGRRYRVGLNLRGVEGAYAGPIVSNDKGAFSLIGARNSLAIDLNQAVEFTFQVDASGKLTMLVGETTIDRDRDVGTGPVGFVAQIYQNAVGGSLELESLEISGAGLSILTPRKK